MQLERATFLVIASLAGCSRNAPTAEPPPAPPMVVESPESPAAAPLPVTPPLAIAAKPTSGKTQLSIHLGNSLTDTLDGYIGPIAQSGGVALEARLETLPGAGLRPLYERRHEEIRQQLTGTRYDHLTVQPYPNLPCYAAGERSDSDFVNRFYSEAKQANPDVQLWIYHQWPKPADFHDCLSEGKTGWGDQNEPHGGVAWRPPTYPVRSWEQAITNQLWYQEQVRKAVMDLNPGGKPVYVIPGGLALLRLKQEVEAGHVPGVARGDFLHVYFQKDGTDDHLLPPGRWFVSLVFYACMFQKDPANVDRGKSGISEEHAAKLREIAWKTVTTYHLSGLPR